MPTKTRKGPVEEYIDGLMGELRDRQIAIDKELRSLKEDEKVFMKNLRNNRKSLQNERARIKAALNNMKRG